MPINGDEQRLIGCIFPENNNFLFYVFFVIAWLLFFLSLSCVCFSFFFVPIAFWRFRLGPIQNVLYRYVEMKFDFE